MSLGLPIINAVWIGRTMGPIHAACLSSFVQTGHTVFLYTYGEVQDAPRGVRIRDANALLPEQKLLRYADGGGVSLSANLIRYQMMTRELGLYVDCDVFCLRPMADSDHVFGWEDDDYINCAVLKLPSSWLATKELSDISDGWVPPWIGGVPKTLAEYPWGTTGPRGLTYVLKKHGLTHLAAPREAFYPVHYYQWQSLFDPDIDIASLIGPNTYYIHLWAEMMRRAEHAELVEGSPIKDLVLRSEAPWHRLAIRRLLGPDLESLL